MAFGLIVAMTAVGAPAGAASAPATTSTSASVPLILVSQTPWVTPNGTFDLRVTPGGGTPPPATLGLSVSVFTCLSSISAFDQSVSAAAGPAGTPIDSTTTPVALSSLPVTAGGVYDLSMPVYVGRGGTVPTGGFAVNLTSTGGQCAVYPSGVYPVRVQLVNTATSQSLGGFTTHLVFSEAPSTTEKLRVGVILPIDATQGAARNPAAAQLITQPSSALAPPSEAATTAVVATVAAISAGLRPSVPLTLDVSPQTVLSLDSTGHASTVDRLADLAATPATHQFASAPFVPVNASALVGAGLQEELALQVARGAQTLAARVPKAVSPTPPAGGLGAWFTNDALDSGALTQLGADGYRQVVVPPSSVPGAPVNESTAEPFSLSPSSGPTMTALVSNADLADRFTSDPGNPVLAASQLAAELAQIYFEKPNDTAPRVVAVMPPSGWSDDPALVGALLDALNQNPVVEPVTASDLFAVVPPGTCRGGCRTVGAAGTSGLPVAAINAERQRVAGFGTAATSAAAVRITTQLGDLVLSGQSERLRPAQQADVLRKAGLAVDAQLSQVQVAGDQSITLTSQKGRVPVTIISDARYPITGTLTLASDKLSFPNGQTRQITLEPGVTNNSYFNVQTRASGLFKVDIALHSPAGGLTLAGGQVTVRSTATSVVGVILSLGAVAVLVVWWLRTSRKRRAQRRAEQAGKSDDLPAEPPVPTGTP